MVKSGRQSNQSSKVSIHNLHHKQKETWKPGETMLKSHLQWHTSSSKVSLAKDPRPPPNNSTDKDQVFKHMSLRETMFIQTKSHDYDYAVASVDGDDE